MEAIASQPHGGDGSWQEAAAHANLYFRREAGAEVQTSQHQPHGDSLFLTVPCPHHLCYGKLRWVLPLPRIPSGEQKLSERV